MSDLDVLVEAERYQVTTEIVSPFDPTIQVTRYEVTGEVDGE